MKNAKNKHIYRSKNSDEYILAVPLKTKSYKKAEKRANSIINYIRDLVEIVKYLEPYKHYYDFLEKIDKIQRKFHDMLYNKE